MSDLLRRATYYLAFASAASILFSIALSQTLLTLALASLLLSGEKLRFPRIGLPLTLFFLTTLAALLASGDPQSGTPQIRKFFIFAIALVICRSRPWCSSGPEPHPSRPCWAWRSSCNGARKPWNKTPTTMASS
jgi:hypothetical protein